LTPLIHFLYREVSFKGLAMILNIKVVPKSSRNGILGWKGGLLKVCVTAPPEKGRANKALEALLSNILNIPKSKIHIIRGVTSHRKVIEVAGVDSVEVQLRIEEKILGR